MVRHPSVAGSEAGHGEGVHDRRSVGQVRRDPPDDAGLRLMGDHHVEVPFPHQPVYPSDGARPGSDWALAQRGLEDDLHDVEVPVHQLRIGVPSDDDCVVGLGEGVVDVPNPLLRSTALVARAHLEHALGCFGTGVERRQLRGRARHRSVRSRLLGFVRGRRQHPPRPRPRDRPGVLARGTTAGTVLGLRSGVPCSVVHRARVWPAQSLGASVR